MPRGDYVVQVKRDLIDKPADDVNGGAVVEAWVDVATVTVGPKTRRRTALRQGLEEAGIAVTPELQARVLGVESAYVWTGKPPSPPSLTLG